MSNTWQLQICFHGEVDLSFLLLPRILGHIIVPVNGNRVFLRLLALVRELADAQMMNIDANARHVEAGLFIRRRR